MSVLRNIWESAERKFLLWLNLKKPEEKDINSEIIKSAYLFFREKQKEYIKTLLYSDYETYFGLDGSVIHPQKSIPKQAREPVFLLEEPDIKSKSYRLTKNIKGILEGNPATLNLIYENYFPSIASYITKNSGTIENAQDIFQDAIVIMLEKFYRSELDLTSSTGTYLYGISKNLWLSHLRKNKKSNSAETVFAGSLTELNFPAENEDSSIDYEKFKTVFENMNKGCRQLIEFYYYQNLKWEKIAELLGYSSAASARNQKYKCLEKLKKQLN